MIEPMLARLGGCMIFAGLMAALVLTVATPQAREKRDVVAAAEVQHRVTASLFARQ